MKRFIKALDISVLIVEIVVAVALVILSVGVLYSLGVKMWDIAAAGVKIAPSDFNAIISAVLGVFIIVELFRIAIAYMNHQNVIPTVLEAALVAVARKFVVFEGGDNYLTTAAGLAVLLLAVSLSWFLLTRAKACETSDALHS